MTKYEDEIVKVGKRFYLARYNAKTGQWSGSLRPDVAKLTGCFGFFCRSEEGIAGAGGYSFASRSAAVAKVRKIRGE